MEYKDAELIHRALEGDDDAFSMLMKKYQKRVHALAWRYICDFHIAEEITQDAFLRAYMRLKTLKDPQRFAGWMYVITRRCCLAWLRKKRLRTQSHEQMKQVDNEQLEETVYSEYVVAEKEKATVENQREIVKKLLEKLQESERTVVTLHYFGEMSCTEIGEFLGVSANTIKSRLRRARQSLKEHEPIIKEALENFKITPNLTENIMREISQTQPTVPSGNKPLVPWLITATSVVVVVMLMLGFGYNKTLTRFQQPYNFDAKSETEIDIVEAPVMKKPTLKPEEQRKIGSMNAQIKKTVSEEQSNDTPSVEDVQANGTVENYPQWEIPKEAKARLGKGGIGAIQFTPDGTQLALSSTLGIWFYDVSTGKEMSLFPGRRGSIALAFSPDGRLIVKGGGNVELWEMATGKNVTPTDAPSLSSSFLFTDNGKTIISIGESGREIIRWNVETGEKKVTEMRERTETSSSEYYELTEDKIAISDRKGKLELWDTTTGNRLFTLKEYGETVRMPRSFSKENHPLTMEFSPDGTQLATGNLDTTVQLWDTTTGKELITLQKPKQSKGNLVFSQDGKNIVRDPMKDERMGRPISLAFSPDGTILACGSEDCTIKLWNTLTGELIVIFTGHLSTIRILAFSPDGNTLASGSADGTVRFWDIRLRNPLQTRIGGHMWMRTASFFYNGSHLASVSSNGIVTVWDMQNSQKTTFKTKATLEEPLYWESYRHYALSPDGTKLANHGRQSDNTSVLRLTDVRTGRELKAFPSGSGRIFSPDGKLLAAWGGNKIRLLNTETGEMWEIIIAEEPDDDSDTHTPVLNGFEFSPDGKKIVSGTNGGLVQMWDVETGVELSSFFEEQPPIDGNYQDSIRAFAFSSDGSLLAVGSRKKIRLLGSSNQPYFKEVSEDDNVYDDLLVFSPDDSVLLRSLYGGEIRLLDVPTGELLTTLHGHSVSLEDLKFSPDNKTLISVGGGNVLFWDWDTVLRSARGENQEHKADVDINIHEQSKEKVIKFVEHSSHPAKSVDRFLTQGEVYLANEWYEAALEQFKRYLFPTNYPPDWNVTTSPSFQRKLFAKIGKFSKGIQNKNGFTDMVNQLIDLSPDSLSIQLNAHLVLAKFYHDDGRHQKAEEHIKKIESITADLPTESLNHQLDASLSMAKYYHESNMVEKADLFIKKIGDMTAELDHNDPYSLKLLLETKFELANYYREIGIVEKADEYIQKTGFVTEDAWMVLGPFDNADGVGYDTAYIPEDITQIDLNAKYDGLNGTVSWKEFTDEEVDGYIHLGEENVNWRVSYAFATVTSPDEREVQFRFDSDDQGKVWLNGNEIFSHTKAFMARIDRYTIPVTLKQGKNSILVKVCNEMGGWAFYLRITDQNGHAFEDLGINRVTQ